MIFMKFSGQRLNLKILLRSLIDRKEANSSNETSEEVDVEGLKSLDGEDDEDYLSVKIISFQGVHIVIP